MTQASLIIAISLVFISVVIVMIWLNGTLNTREDWLLYAYKMLVLCK